MHLIGQNVARFIFELLTVRMKPTTRAKRVQYTPTIEDLRKYRKAERTKITRNWPYSFNISKKNLKIAGSLVEQARSTMPSSFDNSWFDPLENSGGYRAVDWIEFLFFMLPLVFIDFITEKTSQLALVQLYTALRLASQREITSADVHKIKT